MKIMMVKYCLTRAGPQPGTPLMSNSDGPSMFKLAKGSPRASRLADIEAVTGHTGSEQAALD